MAVPNKIIQNTQAGIDEYGDPRARERNTAEIHRLLAQHDFASIEEGNAFLQRTDFSTMHVPPESLGDRAQEVMYDAFEAKGKRRVALAKKAIALYADCADAYTLLAEEAAKTDEEALELYRRAVEAAKRTLPRRCFEVNVGKFWAVLETRPYMRARDGLARLLYEMGERDSAIGHARDLLRLNPTDSQGIRHWLVGRLIECGKDREAGALIDTYAGDDAAVMDYAGALLTYRKFGRGNKARRALHDAFHSNPFVPAVFLLDKLPPEPTNYMPGDESEAVLTVHELLLAWNATPNYLDWMMDEVLAIAGHVETMGIVEPVETVEQPQLDFELLAT